MEYMMN